MKLLKIVTVVFLVLFAAYALFPQIKRIFMDDIELMHDVIKEQGYYVDPKTTGSEYFAFRRGSKNYQGAIVEGDSTHSDAIYFLLQHKATQLNASGRQAVSGLAVASFVNTEKHGDKLYFFEQTPPALTKAGYYFRTSQKFELEKVYILNP